MAEGIFILLRLEETLKKQQMKKPDLIFLVTLVFVILSCSDDDESTTSSNGETLTELPQAFGVFDSDNTSIILDGSEIIIETNGLPNHESPYWSSTNARMGTPAVASDHPLFVEPTVTSYDQMAPGNIDDFNGSYTLTIPAVPQLANTSSATGLGAIGVAVSGAVIYNDQEGPNVPLDNAANSLDFNGAHTGPQSFHYHLEPVTFSNDDDNLVGIISDGFFLYGRKCASTGDYPTDLDASGGHLSSTKYSDEDEYHYHIQNELYLNQYYILFPGDYQGTANAIN